ncbi:15165_t:CDS:2 [Cetraspora pellucida]|uniref:15165_t:CDS:1 n=1 Tax=Cetraspora pellucida TaxID=1433469 RepID=A0A9N9NDX0_9GLOM|nr:15165_t:CDS:2 [Cetraspora pellucida]
MICDQLNNIAIKYNSKSPILILVSTEVAANNINGTTILSALSILIFKTCLDIDDEKLKQLQKRLQNIIYIVINEMSMSVILVNDFGQLPPVCDLPIYVKNPYNHDSVSNDSHILSVSRNYVMMKVLMTRFENKLSKTECNQFSTTIHILTRWLDVDEINFNMLKSLHCPVARIVAVHSGGKEANTADSDTA